METHEQRAAVTPTPDWSDGWENVVRSSPSPVVSPDQSDHRDRDPHRSARAGSGRSTLNRSDADLPALLTVAETADLLRTSRHAVYAMLERGQLPVPLRIGRRLLLRQDELLHWLHQKRAPSLKE
jgi:excisionase family DNA binding protein